MKFPVSMLFDFIDVDADAEALGDLLTMAGFELEGTEEVEGEPVLDVKVMSNRGDGLSVHGLAREVLAKLPHAQPTHLYQRATRYFEDVAIPASNEVCVEIQTDNCTRYGALLFSMDGAQALTPDWMQRRLRQAGMRPISLLVDISNYVMLEIGQPLHAFDRDKLLEGRIVVRQARPGEKLTTLNGDEHELTPDQMVICDAFRAVAVAGVMGGLESEVSEITKSILLESAHFGNQSIRKTRKVLGLSTEASYRFERSVDRELTLAGVRRFSELLNVALGSVTEASLCAVLGEPILSTRLQLRLSRAALMLGMEISREDAIHYLTALGFRCEVVDGDRLSILVPSWRPDIVREIDLIEELGRVHGYERIPEILPEGSTPPGGLMGRYRLRSQLRDALLRLGMNETVSHSLRDLHPLDAWGARIGPRGISAPEIATLRNSLLPCLADACRRNGGREACLFEIGSVFSSEAERVQIAGWMQGPVVPSLRQAAPSSLIDFYVAKGVLVEATRSIGVDLTFEAPIDKDPRLHPTRQASLLGSSQVVGLFGQLHPQKSEELGLVGEAFVFQLDFDRLVDASADHLRLRSLSRNPSVRRDISVLLSKSVSYREIEHQITLAVGEVLERLWVFDDYEGRGVPEGHHALGLAFELRKLGENLTDEEANLARDRAVEALAALGGSLRG